MAVFHFNSRFYLNSPNPPSAYAQHATSKDFISNTETALNLSSFWALNIITHKRLSCPFYNIYRIILVTVKNKVEMSHCHAGANEERSIAPTHSCPWHYMGMSGQCCAPAMLYTWERTPW
jgi:hypothetical protein